MNNQQAFDKIWQTFVVDENPQAIENGTCSYRTEKGFSCAVGCLIPDSEYDSNFEGMGLSRVQSIVPQLAACDYHFLGRCQVAHDTYVSSSANVSFVEHMDIELRKIAKNHQLTVPAIEGGN